MTTENELLARAIHEDYVRRRRSQGLLAHDDPSVRDWEELPETLRRSNRDQAEDIARKLESIGCEVVSSNAEASAPLVFAPDELERLAQMEHERWTEERLRDGWQAGLDRDSTEKRSPYLVPWADLSEEARDLDRDAVGAIPAVLAKAGLSVVRRRADDRPGRTSGPR